MATVLSVIAVLSVASYCAGKQEGSRSEKLKANGVRIQTAEHAARAQRIAVMKALDSAAKAGQTHQTARARVVIINDTVIQVDTLPPMVVPAPVVDLERASDAKIRADSIAIVSLQAQVAAERARADAWQERAQLLKPPRCGIKCGIVIGGTTALALVVALASVF